jgi:hypothetical protein
VFADNNKTDIVFADKNKTDIVFADNNKIHHSVTDCNGYVDSPHTSECQNKLTSHKAIPVRHNSTAVPVFKMLELATA